MHRNSNIGHHYTGGDDIRTVLIVGSNRSGTSMLAGTLHLMGVFMGATANPPFYEDGRLASALKRGGHYKEIIQDYNQHPLWGFKRPSANKFIFKNVKQFRQPLFIHLHRDPVAVASRTSQMMKTQFLYQIKKTSRKQIRILKRVNKIAKKYPVFYCSYEKILLYPDRFVDKLSEILVIDITTDQRKKIIEFIHPENRHYLDRVYGNKLL